MGQADVERFTDDLKKDPRMLDEVKPLSGDLAGVVAFAASKGYHFTVDDAKAYLNGRAGGELNDAQLDAVAGGDGGLHRHPGSDVPWSSQQGSSTP